MKIEKNILSQKDIDNLLDEHEKNENIIHPPYYAKLKIEPIDFIIANNLDFVRGNIIKYIMRYDDKNGLDDLKKAQLYLNKLIEIEEKKNEIQLPK